jgi:hypothetical protein
MTIIKSDRDKDETVEFYDCIVVHSTDKACLIKLPDMPQTIWFPISQIHADSEIWKQGDEGLLVVTKWIAEKKGLVSND